ncbi:uncharacterized protein LAESUDRAFT_716322 [Laetiporus sulphureus 93-53]|uniref:WD40 repeat-like protein n=1 Tax=Laetiporus sulphureus 93-53 TaxID=1314785 RepID=A0A165CRS2_9APHY|nr:uncharacterized protein LAESUDRAFT_716322 [Laetiporus sulphureus 93-53]KZT03317.1 hypothetical protein LAESUDRAFT_716322 [Laetiporus sulphureus 93-53]
MTSTRSIHSTAAIALGIQDCNQSSYQCRACIVDIGQIVYTIFVSPDGQMLAYGGSIGLKICMCETTEHVLEPDYSKNIDGQVTNSQWADDDTVLFGTHYGYIHIFMKDKEAWSMILRALLFPDEGNMWMFSLHDGHMCSISVQTGEILSKPRWMTDVIFSLHQMNSGLEVATYTAVITGSDHGKVYIFDKKGGELIDVLGHAPKGLVQSITVQKNSLCLK